MSFGMMVTRLAWMAHKLVSSKRPTRYASDASWSANTAVLWNRKSVLKSCAISRTRRWNGSLRIKSSVDFWYLLRHRNVRFITHSSVTHPSSNLTNFRVDARLSSRHAPNLTKRDGTRAVSVRLLHACERARKIVSRQSPSSISLASTRIAPTVRIVVPSAPARE